MTDRFILEPERKRTTGVSSVTWWRLERKGQAPKRRQLTAGRVGWLESEIKAWMESRPFSELPSPNPDAAGGAK